MYIPNKITFRLDYTNKQLLEKYLEMKLNKTASQVIRAALRRFLDDELKAMSMDAPPAAQVDRPLEDKFAKSTAKGAK